MQEICYCSRRGFVSAQTQWGITHEKVAIQCYSTMQASLHNEHTVRKAGHFISREHPFLAASPDGIIACSCCGMGCLEVKCPYNCRTINDVVARPNSYLGRNQDGKVVLRRTHSYFYQIQAQMFCSETRYCDFFVYHESQCYLERVYYDETFIEQCVVKAKKFFDHCVLIELAGKVYSNKMKKITVGVVVIL